VVTDLEADLVANVQRYTALLDALVDRGTLSDVGRSLPNLLIGSVMNTSPASCTLAWLYHQRGRIKVKLENNSADGDFP